ncbi:MAG: ATP-binding protein [Candidatus Dadabacteria bacterium]|nr:ATP-binding protein [Candidatus Dadabacteria bacterium]MCZ6685604.1 ATP-binding protein [Candidatus Dadabacteria bacterium]
MTDKVAGKKKVNYKEIFDAFPESIIIIDKNFLILDMNDNAETTFRISRQKAQGRATNLFMPIEMEQLAKRAILEERTIVGDETNPTLRSGDKISIQAIASPLFTIKGNIKGVILQIKDMTATKFLSSKSIQEISTSRFETLMSGLAHELKNPLSGIRGAAQLLADETENIETIKCAEIITKEADRLKSLLDSLKQLEPFAEELLEPLDIHDILMEIIYLESLSDTNKNIQYKQNYDITLPPVQGDRNSLKQVFLNLIKNASQAIEVKGKIEVSTRWITEHKLKGQKAISVEIEDNGNGIARESLEKIFSPFYTTRKEGSGLGLFLAYQIIAKHGGAVLVESEPGKGTVFKVYLPVSTN